MLQILLAFLSNKLEHWKKFYFWIFKGSLSSTENHMNIYGRHLTNQWMITSTIIQLTRLHTVPFLNAVQLRLPVQLVHCGFDSVSPNPLVLHAMLNKYILHALIFNVYLRFLIIIAIKILLQRGSRHIFVIHDAVWPLLPATVVPDPSTNAKENYKKRQCYANHKSYRGTRTIWKKKQTATLSSR